MEDESVDGIATTGWAAKCSCSILNTVVFCGPSLVEIALRSLFVLFVRVLAMGRTLCRAHKCLAAALPVSTLL